MANIASFDVNALTRLLETRWLGRRFWYFKELGSTNAYLKDKEPDSLAHGLVCLTDSQTNGKGLYGRDWQSEMGSNLTFTIVFKPQYNQCLQTLNLMTALSVLEVLQEKSDHHFSLKWPNDVYYRDRKIAGLLTETAFTGNVLDRILVGVGLNINQTHFNGDLNDKACSLATISNNDKVCREDILACILKKVEQYYAHWETEQEWLLKSINRKLIGYGKWVKLQVDGNLVKTPFKLLGINSTGYLHVLNTDDELKVFTHEQVRIYQDA